MKILVSGASGLIGSHLVPEFQARGHQVWSLVRRAPKHENEIQWTRPLRLDPGSFDSVIHLAGETIVGRWTKEKKDAILRSRVDGTSDLSAAVATSGARVLIAASAVGIYGPHGDEVLTEASPSGNDFLSYVAREWEGATAPACHAGVRVINFRIGVVLTPEGGALKQMLAPFRLGVGGRIGSGKQWMSWITLDDVVGAILHAVDTPSLQGPTNLVAPNPVTNAEFTKALGAALRRPAVLPVPKFAIRFLFGEMGESLLLSGQRVIPSNLAASGYRFSHSEIGEALRAMLR